MGWWMSALLFSLSLSLSQSLLARTAAPTALPKSYKEGKNRVQGIGLLTLTSILTKVTLL